MVVLPAHTRCVRTFVQKLKFNNHLIRLSPVFTRRINESFPKPSQVTIVTKSLLFVEWEGGMMRGLAPTKTHPQD